MFAVKINKSQFEYDVHSLVKAFYPEEMVKVLTPEMSSEKNKEWEENIRIEIILQDDGASVKVKDAAEEYIWHREEAESTYKNEFKKFLYKTLCDMTGKELPWGNLTGIRPTKIAMGLLEEGKTEEEIAAALQKEHFVSTEKADLSVRSGKKSCFPIFIMKKGTACISAFRSARRPVCTVPLPPIPSASGGTG